MRTAILAAAVAALTASPLLAQDDFRAKSPPPGYRGMAVPVADYELQFIEKNDRIDVLTTFEAALPGRKKPEWVTATLLQNVLVLQVNPPSAVSRVGSIEVALNPNEGQYLALALQSKKAVTILLRGKGDAEMHPMEMASFGRLFGEPAVEEPKR